MTEIRLVKKYPHIKDEDVISIFQDGYIKGFKNGRKGAISVEWIKQWRNDKWFSKRSIEERTIMAMGVRLMLEDWEKENANR